MRLIDKLRKEEKEYLRESLKRTKELNEYQRIFCVFNYDEGVEVSQIAKQMLISERTVYDYLKSYANQRKTQDDNRGGSSEKLSESQSAELGEHLKNNTYL